MTIKARQGYAEWIATEPHDLFLTVTAADRTSPEAMLKRTRYILNRIAQVIYGQNAKRKGLLLSAVIAIERQGNGNPHSHTLARFPVSTDLSPDRIRFLQDLATETGGFCKLELPRAQTDVAAYVAKYVTKDGELHFTSNWRPRTLTPALL